MASEFGGRFATLSAEELLGPLNEVEAKFAPKRLFVMGDRELLSYSPRVAIIGSRRASEEGLRRAAKLSRELVKRGVSIVSGLAEGIDTVAHSSAIQAGGRTIAVIGTPLNVSFPAKNRDLQNRISADHLLISQFESGTPIQRKNFPLRNRTMALLSHASVIVEAGETSGSLSQGWEALRLGRPLFLLQSVLENPTLQWPKEMIDYGASVLSESEDVLDVIPRSSKAGYAELAF
jgi:DNA processing protein